MTTIEIEVTIRPSGDSATADSPEAALVAAKTLCADDAAAVPIQGRERVAEFRVDDVLIRVVPERDLWGAIPV